MNSNNNSSVIGYIAEASTTVETIDSNGNIQEKRIGDPVFLDETIINESGSPLVITLLSGQTFIVPVGQQMVIGTEWINTLTPTASGEEDEESTSSSEEQPENSLEEQSANSPGQQSEASDSRQNNQNQQESDISESQELSQAVIIEQESSQNTEPQSEDELTQLEFNTLNQQDNAQPSTSPASIAPVIESQSFDVNENVPVDGSTVIGQVFASDPGDVTYAITGGNEDNAFTIKPTTGEILVTGPLNHESRDSYNLTVEVTNQAGLSESTSISISINDLNEAPEAQADFDDSYENHSVTIDVLANDVDEDLDDSATLSVSAASIVSMTNDGDSQIIPLSTASISFSGNNVTFDPGTDFDYLATGETATVLVNYTVTDDDGTPLTDSSTLTLTVTGTNDRPSTTVNSSSGIEDTDYTFTLEDFPFTDIDSTDRLEAIQFTQLSAEGQLLLDTNGDSVADTSITTSDPISRSDLESGRLIFRPQQDFSGTTSLSFQVSDGIEWSESASLSIDFANQADPAVFSGDSTGAVIEDNTATDSYLISATTGPGSWENVIFDPNNNRIYIDNRVLDVHGSEVTHLRILDIFDSPVTFDRADSWWTFFNIDPIGSFDPSSSQFSGAIRQIHSSYALSTNVASEPLSSADELVTTGALTATDPDSGESGFIEEAISGSYGTFTIDSNGNWNYSADNTQPAIQALGVGDSLTESITVRSIDGSSHNVTITINGTNDQPVVEAITASASEDGSIITGNFGSTDADTSDTLSYIIQTTPGEGTVTNNNDGTFSFNPGNDFQDLAEGETRQVSFTYVAVDDSNTANATSEPGTVTITVTGTNDAPQMTSVNIPDAPLPQEFWDFADGSYTGANGAVFTPSSTPTFVAGPNSDHSSAIHFDGVDDKVSATFNASETAFSTSFWFRTTEATGGLFEVHSGTSGHDRSIYLENGQLKGYLWQGGPTEIISSTDTYNDGEWHHVTYTLGGEAGGQTLYVDGRQVASGEYSFSGFTSQTNIQLGHSNYVGGHLEGDIAGFNIYDEALSSDDVLNIMQGTDHALQIPFTSTDGSSELTISDPEPFSLIGKTVQLNYNVGNNSGTETAVIGEGSEFQLEGWDNGFVLSVDFDTDDLSLSGSYNTTLGPGFPVVSDDFLNFTFTDADIGSINYVSGGNSNAYGQIDSTSNSITLTQTEDTQSWNFGNLQNYTITEAPAPEADQSQSAIAATDDNGAIAVWLAEEGGSYAIMGKRLTESMDGLVTAGSEFKINTNDPTSNHNMSAPDIIVLENGNYVVAWEYSVPGSNSTPRIKVYNDNGDVITDEFAVGYDDYYSNLTALSGNRFALLNMDPGGGHVVRVNIFDDSGNSLTTFNAGSANTWDWSKPVMTELDNGNYAVVWRTSKSGSNNARFRIFDSNGNPTTSEASFGDHAANNSHELAIETLSSGHVVSAYQSTDDVYLQRWSPDGTPQGGPIRINATTAGIQSQPEVTSLADGSFYITWTSENQDGAGNGIYGRHFGADGVAISGETLINETTAGNQSDPHVVQLADGTLQVTWTSDQNGNNDVFSRTLAVGNQVTENAANGTMVGQVTATDIDGDTITYSLLDDSDGRFAIDSATGVITVADGSKLNYEDSAQHTIIARATDTHGAFSDQTLTLKINDQAEQVSSADASLLISQSESFAFSADTFEFNQGDGLDSLQSVTINSLPSLGSLTLNGAAVLAGQTIAAADLPSLVYTAGTTGTGSFAFSVSDGATSSAEYTFNINSQNAQVATNLVTNPGATSGTTGWSIIANGGNGWATNSGNHDGDGASWITSYGWARKSQTIDLLAKGFSADYLDSQPIISVSDWYAQSTYGGDLYNLKVQLRDGSNNVIATYDTGTITAVSGWSEASHSFENYGSGVRRIYIEHGGRDGENWGGHYGTRIDDTSITIGEGQIEINGTASDDILAGTAGDDELIAQAGHDKLYGAAGNDTLSGGEGNDLIVGGAGDDILSGGAGEDIFDFNFADIGTASSPAIDTITDFNLSEGDVLDISDLLSDEENNDLTQYLSFDQADPSNPVLEIRDTADGDITQKINLQGVDLSVFGSTDTEIIDGLLNNGNLGTDS
ncbi:VCBS domain-containing protein [Endozoicomonas atrinae]|uniref:VCBS domain-containing protein n=1 Tax=Endozoicomonas atrinae TaxID=1333660 RepID=UPI000825ACE5|nr:VCBS domain-containing protein [Endozoicomonas atrinae]